jgi:hypothetical protein
MCCGNQNKMDDTKAYDIRKHIPWRYISSNIPNFHNLSWNFM